MVTPHLYGRAPPPRPISDIAPATLDIVKKGMYRVIYGENGTGRRVRVAGVEIAGKSGTAQVPNQEDAWFVAFAPYDVPEIAVAVVIEGGGAGGANAGPVVRKVLEAYFDTRSEPSASLSQRLERPALDEAPQETTGI